MKRLRCAALATVGLVIGCAPPGPNVPLYRSLREPGAIQTCDANASAQISAIGSDEATATANGERKLRDAVNQTNNCGAYIVDARAGKQRDGSVLYTANFHYCHCK